MPQENNSSLHGVTVFDVHSSFDSMVDLASAALICALFIISKHSSSVNPSAPCGRIVSCAEAIGIALNMIVSVMSRVMSFFILVFVM